MYERDQKRIFKHASIRKLLFYWAVLCSVVMGLLALTIILLNQSITDSQQRLLQQSLPIETSTRSITRIISDLTIRKGDILITDDLARLQYKIDRTSLDEEFQQQLNLLINSAQDNSLAMDEIRIMQSLSTEFRKTDDLMVETFIQLLSHRDALNKDILLFEKLSRDILLGVDYIVGNIALQASRSIRQSHDQSLSNRSVIENLLIQQRDIQQFSNQLSSSISSMLLLGRKIITENDLDVIVHIQKNEIPQQNNLILSELTKAQAGLIMDEFIIQELQKIEKTHNEIIDILINRNDSIINLRKDIIALNKQLTYHSEEFDREVARLKASLDTLSQMARRISVDAGRNIYNNLSQITLVVTIVSMFIVLVILISINFLFLRIKNPLEKIREGMSLLSSGKLQTRLDEAQFAQDEFLGIATDFNRFAAHNQILIEELSNANKVVEESEQRTRAMLENALVGIVHLIDRRIIMVNHKFEEMFGYKRDEVIGQYTEVIYESSDMFIELGNLAYPLLQRGETYSGEWKCKRKDGGMFWCAISAKAIEAGNIKKGSIWLYEDISQRKETEKELIRLANYDPLTELPNRALFLDRLKNNIEHAKRTGEFIALLFIDLDRFKKINDSFGHDAGDQLLKTVARRLSAAIRSADTIARLGGDEFVLLLTSIRNNTVPAKIARKILETLSPPIMIENHEITITPSIGISIFPHDGDDNIKLLKNADAAMYHAKSAGRNNYQFYTRKMNEEALFRLELENKLRVAVENRDFEMFYQPYVETVSRRIVGYEALLRYKDQENIRLPGQIIPILEDTGLILPLGDWVIQNVCTNQRYLVAANQVPARVSINLSARQFQYGNLIHQIESAIKKSGIDPAFLELEITESLLIEGHKQTKNLLMKLNSIGVRISLDDFGTGYSSLAYLKEFPINTLKIDKSFVQNSQANSSDAAICETILAMAKNLGLEVIAEGVENESQYEFLASRGCDYIQGFLIGKPLPITGVDLYTGEGDKPGTGYKDFPRH